MSNFRIHSNAGGCLPLLLMVGVFGCVSAKEHITDGLNTVQVESASGEATLVAVVGLPMEPVIRVAIKSALGNFRVITKTAAHASTHLGGIKDKGWSIWTKLSIGAGILGVLGAIVMRFGAGGMLVSLGGGILGRVMGLFKRKA